MINSGVDQVRKLVKADKMAFIVLGFRRSCGYAYMERNQKKRVFGIEMGSMKREERGNFPEKKNSEGMG